MSRTLREIHEGCKARHAEGDFHDSWSEQTRCVDCKRFWPCPDYSDAVAALDILNESEHRDWDGFNAWPVGIDWPEASAQSKSVAVRLVPDPVPGSTIATRETHT